jgi:hypothetical protein
MPYQDNYQSTYDASLPGSCAIYDIPTQCTGSSLDSFQKRKTYDELRWKELLNYFRWFQSVPQKDLLVFIYDFSVFIQKTLRQPATNCC